MSELNEARSSKRSNPLIWVSLVVIGLIIFIFVSGDRNESVAVIKPVVVTDDDTSGSIERSLLVPPGLRARQYIEQLRADGKPYPLQAAYELAQKYLQEGSLADAHLLFFFAAREDHLGSIMVMGEMSDPTLFRAEDSLLDDADVIQAYKWYQKAAGMGNPAAAERVAGLQQWASAAPQAENPHARQLLLNFR